MSGSRVVVGVLIVLAIFAASIGILYGQRLVRSFNTSSTPKPTTLIDETATLKVQYLGGGYDWKLTLNQGEKLTVSIQSNDTVFLDLSEDRSNSPLNLQCNSNPVYALPQTQIHDTSGTTNGRWSVSIPEDCGYRLSVNPPMATYYTNGQTISVHVIVIQTG